MSTYEDFGSPGQPDSDPLIEGTRGGKVFAGCDPEAGQRGCRPNAEQMPHFAAPGSSMASIVYVVGQRIMFHEYMQNKISEERRGGAD